MKESAADKDKIFGISLSVFCKIMMRLMENPDEPEDHKDMDLPPEKEGKTSA